MLLVHPSQNWVYSVKIKAVLSCSAVIGKYSSKICLGGVCDTVVKLVAKQFLCFCFTTGNYYKMKITV